ncbi:unnamed protein product, partial [Vitis vinifera]|uniref:Uncharacterized protein n=1 Tax=Vitis vinifera TaxID=29760 RepID=D7U2W2_VITVI
MTYAPNIELLFLSNSPKLHELQLDLYSNLALNEPNKHAIAPNHLCNAYRKSSPINHNLRPLLAEVVKFSFPKFVSLHFLYIKNNKKFLSFYL